MLSDILSVIDASQQIFLRFICFILMIVLIHWQGQIALEIK
ncbi:hypothetical protein URS_0739 [Acinetobacter ursingii]|nr:hypothetical protein URS_0739 [Acinetobacter ursingii]